MSGEESLTYREVVEILAPLARGVKPLVQFTRDPYGFVASIISLYIINTVLNLGAFAVNVVLAAFDILTSGLEAVRYVLSLVLGDVGNVILGVMVSIQQEVAAVVGSAGPLGPPIAGLAVALVLYGLYRLAVAALGEIPLGSSIVDLLGLK